MKKLSTSAADAAHVAQYVGINLAKNVFAVHSVNAQGKPC